jgi:hypothetical protein
MSQPPPIPDRPQPPAPPLPPLGYAHPGHPGPPPPPHSGPAPVSDVQRVFDTVAGPNIRLRDNLIQLACVVVGTALGALIGRALQGPSSDAPMMLVGALVGLIGSLLISGLVIGIVRMAGASRKRRGP